MTSTQGTHGPSPMYRLGVRRRALLGLGSLILLAIPALAPAQGSVCSDPSRATVGLTPLTDLGATPYGGAPGGLYPGGSNVRPPAHEAAGIHVASNRVIPRDALGRPDPVRGKIVILTIGMSNVSMESDAFRRLVQTDPLRHPAVQVVNGAESGATAALISDPAHPYWQRLLQRITSSGVTPQQVQVIWYKEANARPTQPFPQHAQVLEAQSTLVMQTLASRFPKVAQCFVSSRIYAGYATTTLNPEPFAYESVFAYKWMIESQIHGAPELNYDPRIGPVNAPWLSWGPYLWADGLNARSDGLVWSCVDFQSDGTHPSSLGTDKVAAALLSFFRTDVTTAPWYRAPQPTSVDVLSPPASFAIRPARPNPFATRLAVPVQLAAPEHLRATVYSLAGRRIAVLEDGLLPAGTHELVWNGRDARGRSVPSGTYWVRVEAGLTTRSVKATLVR